MARAKAKREIIFARTDNSDIDARFADGVPPAGVADITIASIPDFIISTGSAFTRNMRTTYMSGADAAAAVLTINVISGTLATVNLSFSSPNLSSASPSVGTVTLQLQAVSGTSVFKSNNFSVTVSASAPPDTLAPPVPFGFKAVQSGNTTNVSVEWSADTESSTVPATNPVKLVIERSVDSAAYSTLTTLTAGSSQPSNQFVESVVGSMGTPSFSQSGNSWTLNVATGDTTSSHDFMYIVGNNQSGDFEISGDLPVYASGTQFSAAGFICRQNNTAFSPCVQIERRPDSYAIGATLVSRATQGGTITVSTAKQFSGALRGKLKRVGNVFSFQTWNTTTFQWDTVASTTVVMTNPVVVGMYGLRGLAGTSIAINFTNVRISKLGTATYADNTITAGHTYDYRAKAMDSAGNSSAYTDIQRIALNVDSIAPTVPGAPVALVQTTGGVSLDWSPSTDTGGSGLGNYLIKRNGTLIQTIPAITYVDDPTGDGTQIPLDNSNWFDPNGVVNNSYTIGATDGSGNASAFSGAGIAVATGGGGGSANLILYEDWESGQIRANVWNNPVNLGTDPPERKQVQTISRRKGSYALRCYIDDSTAYATSKSPLHTEVGFLQEEFFGIEYWLGFSVYLENWVTEISAKVARAQTSPTVNTPWDIIWQDHGEEYYTVTNPANGQIIQRGLNPPANLSVRTDDNDGLGYLFFQILGTTQPLSVITNNFTYGTSPSYERSVLYKMGRYTPNKWHDIVIHQKLSTRAAPTSGFYNVWMNGTQYVADTGINCYPNTTKGNTGALVVSDVHKLGIYKGWSPPISNVHSRAVIHDEIRWGRTIDAVDYADVYTLNFAGPIP
jgi:hypothetical protein